jgi:hypothetical protein
LSGIFIQVGNSYVDQLKEAEMKSGIKVLGEFDFNYQAYKILKYLDEDIDFFATYTRKWVEIGTNIYNVLRLFTRYSIQESKISESPKFDREICFVTIKKLRSTEFNLLNDFVALIEQKGRDANAASKLIHRYELKRRFSVIKLNIVLEEYADLFEIRELYKETKGYLAQSEIFTNELNKMIPCSA